MELFSYKDNCRLCLKTHTDLMKNIFTHCVEGYQDTLVQNIFSMFRVELNPHQDYPQFVCRKCLTELENILLFKEDLRRTQHFLLGLFTAAYPNYEKNRHATNHFNDSGIFLKSVAVNTETENKNLGDSEYIRVPVNFLKQFSPHVNLQRAEVITSSNELITIKQTKQDASSTVNICKYCSKKFRSQSLVNAHCKEVHKYEQQKTYNTRKRISNDTQRSSTKKIKTDKTKNAPRMSFKSPTEQIPLPEMDVQNNNNNDIKAEICDSHSDQQVDTESTESITQENQALFLQNFNLIAKQEAELIENQQKSPKGIPNMFGFKKHIMVLKKRNRSVVKPLKSDNIKNRNSRKTVSMESRKRERPKKIDQEILCRSVQFLKRYGWRRLSSSSRRGTIFGTDRNHLFQHINVTTKPSPKKVTSPKSSTEKSSFFKKSLSKQSVLKDDDESKILVKEEGCQLAHNVHNSKQTLELTIPDAKIKRSNSASSRNKSLEANFIFEEKQFKTSPTTSFVSSKNSSKSSRANSFLEEKNIKDLPTSIVSIRKSSRTVSRKHIENWSNPELRSIVRSEQLPASSKDEVDKIQEQNSSKTFSRKIIKNTPKTELESIVKNEQIPISSGEVDKPQEHLATTSAISNSKIVSGRIGKHTSKTECVSVVKSEQTPREEVYKAQKCPTTISLVPNRNSKTVSENTSKVGTRSVVKSRQLSASSKEEVGRFPATSSKSFYGKTATVIGTDKKTNLNKRDAYFTQIAATNEAKLLPVLAIKTTPEELLNNHYKKNMPISPNKSKFSTAENCQKVKLLQSESIESFLPIDALEIKKELRIHVERNRSSEEHTSYSPSLFDLTSEKSPITHKKPVVDLDTTKLSRGRRRPQKVSTSISLENTNGAPTTCSKRDSVTSTNKRGHPMKKQQLKEELSDSGSCCLPVQEKVDVNIPATIDNKMVKLTNELDYEEIEAAPIKRGRPKRNLIGDGRSLSTIAIKTDINDFAKNYFTSSNKAPLLDVTQRKLGYIPPSNFQDTIHKDLYTLQTLTDRYEKEDNIGLRIRLRKTASCESLNSLKYDTQELDENLQIKIEQIDNDTNIYLNDIPDNTMLTTSYDKTVEDNFMGDIFLKSEETTDKVVNLNLEDQEVQMLVLVSNPEEMDFDNEDIVEYVKFNNCNLNLESKNELNRRRGSLPMDKSCSFSSSSDASDNTIQQKRCISRSQTSLPLGKHKLKELDDNTSKGNLLSSNRSRSVMTNLETTPAKRIGRPPVKFSPSPFITKRSKSTANLLNKSLGSRDIELTPEKYKPRSKSANQLQVNVISKRQLFSEVKKRNQPPKEDETKIISANARKNGSSNKSQKTSQQKQDYSVPSKQLVPNPSSPKNHRFDASTQTSLGSTYDGNLVAKKAVSGGKLSNQKEKTK